MAARKPSRKAPPRVPDVHVHLPPNDDRDDDRETRTDDDGDGGDMIDQAEREVRAQTQEVDSRIVVKLYRKHPALGNRKAFLVELDKDDFSQDYVQEAYGGGRYSAEFFGPIRGKGGKPGRGPIRTITFEVDLSIPPKSPTNPFALTAGDSGTAAPSLGGSRIDALMESGLMSLFSQMQRANEMQAAAMQRILEGSQRSSVDWTALLGAVSPIVVALFEGMMNRPDPMKAAREIAELATNRKNPLEDIRSLVETMGALREATGGGSEPDPDTPPWLRVLERTAGPLIARAISNDQISAVANAHDAEVNNAPHRGALAPPPPHAAGMDHPSPLPIPSVDMAQFPGLQIVAPLVPNLAQWASQGRAAEWAAETVLYDIPVGYHAAIAERLGAADFMENMLKAFPVLSPFHAWLGEFRTAMLGQLTEDGGSSAEK